MTVETDHTELLPKENLERSYIAVADNAFGRHVALRPSLCMHVSRALAAASGEQSSDLRIVEQRKKMSKTRIGRGGKIGLRFARERILRQKSEGLNFLKAALDAGLFGGRGGRENADSRSFRKRA